MKLKAFKSEYPIPNIGLLESVSLSIKDECGCGYFMRLHQIPIEQYAEMMKKEKKEICGQPTLFSISPFEKKLFLWPTPDAGMAIRPLIVRFYPPLEEV